MRIVIAPDKFAGTLTAVQAATAIADGWARHAPHDVLDLAPMSDGGPGFVDVLHAALGGEVLAATVSGPEGGTVPATILLVGDTAYVESAQAAGLHLCHGDPHERTTAGVGELINAAVAAGAATVVVGLGGSGTVDGGRGMLETLTVRPTLVAATDVDTVLTGLFGAAKTFGEQKGFAAEDLPALDAALAQWSESIDRKAAMQPGAGAAGGLGFALFTCGATRRSGIELVAEAVSLSARAHISDLVITGEGAFDFSSRSGKVPYGVAQIAQEALRPCIALAGEVLVGSREMRAMGVESAYSLVDLVGRERAFSDPVEALADLAERVARTWSRGVGE